VTPNTKRVIAALAKWIESGQKPKQYGRKWCVKKKPKPVYSKFKMG